MSAFQTLAPREAFHTQEQSPDAVLIDCRTQAEWAYAGVPVLSQQGATAAFIEWVDAAGMPNPEFLSTVRQVAEPRTAVFMLCRSGVRSAAACQFLAAAGFAHLVNIAEGFEGDIGPNGQRASINGWKFHGLPWTQR